MGFGFNASRHDRFSSSKHHIKLWDATIIKRIHQIRKLKLFKKYERSSKKPGSCRMRKSSIFLCEEVEKNEASLKVSSMENKYDNNVANCILQWAIYKLPSEYFSHHLLSFDRKMIIFCSHSENKFIAQSQLLLIIGRRFKRTIGNDGKIS